MAVVQNKYWNNPEIGQFFGTLGQFFAPPSADEMVAGSNIRLNDAKTSDIQQKAREVREQLDMARSPDFNQATFDRGNIALGTYAPNQGYELTTRGQDLTASTSRANNSADNARALTQTGMEQRGDTDRAMLAPVGAGATRFVPPGIADMYRVPQQQVGSVSVSPGERVTTPDGRTFDGAPKPLSETEWRAQQGQGLRDRGLLSDDQLKAIVMGDTPTETILADGIPQIVFRNDAIGQTPAPKGDNLTPIGKAQAELNALPPGDPRRADYENYIRAQGQPRQENAYSAEIGKQFAGQYGSIATAANAARQNQGALDAMARALDNPSVVTGAGGSLALNARRLGATIGLGDTKTLGDTEVIAAVGNKLALDLRNPAGGAGMPGAMSDADRDFLSRMAPGLAQSPAGNRQLIEMQRRVNQRSIDVEQLANDYAQKNGQLDAGFQVALSQWANAHPLFSQNGADAPAAPAPAIPAQPAVPPTAAPAAPAQQGDVPTVASPEEAAKLPPGTRFRTPDGQLRTRH